jgi:hypothetical protein
MHKDAQEMYREITQNYGASGGAERTGGGGLPVAGSALGAGTAQAPPPPSYQQEDDPYLFFSMHDLNFDGFLDGHELLTLFAKYAMEGATNNQRPPVLDAKQMKELEAMVHHSLEEDDLDADGLISREEFMISEHKAQKKA